MAGRDLTLEARASRELERMMTSMTKNSKSVMRANSASLLMELSLRMAARQSRWQHHLQPHRKPLKVVLQFRGKNRVTNLRKY